jgi:putative Mn2+ efflux pump MntP
LDLFAALLVALGLAMDAFSVSVVQGMETREHRIANGLGMAGSFGIFHPIFPNNRAIISTRYHKGVEAKCYG